MNSILFSTISLFFASNAMPVEKSEVTYMDVASLQIDRRVSWSFGNLGFNLSRYFGIADLENKSLYPGIGIRAKIGENPKIELFPKISFAGIVGGSVGGAYGENGIGLGASLWAGLGVFGSEYSFYSDKIGIDQEVSLYIAYQFGLGGIGKYRFENILSEFASGS